MKDANVGDLYLGQFSGIDEEGGGSRLYRKQENGDWLVLMDTVKKSQIEIHNMDELKAFAEKIALHDGYAEKEVHLKTNIYFKAENAGAKGRAARAVDGWTPIGTSEVPFKGNFDGEGHIIYDFKTEVSTNATDVGFFGNVDGATIQHLHFVDVIVDATQAEESSVGAVVVGQAQGKVTVKDVTVTGATVQAAENDNANVGGLVGKLENSSEGTELTVEGSKVESSAEGTEFKSVDSLVADQSKVNKENVKITDSTVSTVTNNGTETTGWTESGNRYEEQTTGEAEGETTTERTYFASSAEDLESLLSAAEKGAPLNVALDGDLTLAGTTDESFALDLAGKDMVLDIAGNNLTLNTEDKNAQFTVSGGSKLTVTNSSQESGTVNMGRVENKPVISVNGEGSELNIENVTVEVQNTYDCNNDRNTYKIAPAIVAENKGTVNIGNGTTMTAHGQKDNNTSYKEPQIAAAKGNDSTIMVNGKDIEINLKNATGLYAQEGGKIDFRSGTINMEGGGCCVALGLGYGKNSKIVFSGGTINISGELSGKHISNGDLPKVAFAIGSASESCSNAEVIVNGGVINLAPVSGIAIAFGGYSYPNSNSNNVYVGDKAAVNLNATQSGKAYVAASTDGNPCFIINVYNDTQITGVDEKLNFKSPESDISGGYSFDLTDFGIKFLDEEYFRGAKDLADEHPEYTKKGMGIE